MKLTKRLQSFIKEVAEVATSEENSDVTYNECIAEYTDQVINDDYSNVIYYADYKGITIPRALKNVLKKEEWNHEKL